jgi:hypothetical protein
LSQASAWKPRSGEADIEGYRFVASAQGFVEQPAVIDVASQLLVDLSATLGDMPPR